MFLMRGVFGRHVPPHRPQVPSRRALPRSRRCSGATLSNKFASLSPIPHFAPLAGRHKVYILDRVDSLEYVGRERVLKTLEEPPDDVTIILLGRTREAVLPTIVSRCQVVPFRHIPASEASGILVRIRAALFLRPPLPFRRWAAPSRRRLSFYAQGARRVPHENHRCHGLAFARR